MTKHKQHGIEYPYITVTKGMAGFFAVMVWWNPEGFSEPYESGQNRYPMQIDAIAEAREWATDAKLPFRQPKQDDSPARQDVAKQMEELVPGIKVVRI